jgi:hypothetical protein
LFPFICENFQNDDFSIKLRGRKQCKNEKIKVKNKKLKVSQAECVALELKQSTAQFLTFAKTNFGGNRRFSLIFYAIQICSQD